MHVGWPYWLEMDELLACMCPLGPGHYCYMHVLPVRGSVRTISQLYKSEGGADDES